MDFANIKESAEFKQKAGTEEPSFRKDLPWTFLVSEDALRKLTHPVWPCPHIGRWVLWCNQQFQTSESLGRRGCRKQFLLLPSQLLMFCFKQDIQGMVCHHFSSRCTISHSFALISEHCHVGTAREPYTNSNRIITV